MWRKQKTPNIQNLPKKHWLNFLSNGKLKNICINRDLIENISEEPDRPDLQVAIFNYLCVIDPENKGKFYDFHIDSLKPESFQQHIDLNSSHNASFKLNNTLTNLDSGIQTQIFTSTPTVDFLENSLIFLENLKESYVENPDKIKAEILEHSGQPLEILKFLNGDKKELNLEDPKDQNFLRNIHLYVRKKSRLGQPRKLTKIEAPIIESDENISKNLNNNTTIKINNQVTNNSESKENSEKEVPLEPKVENNQNFSDKVNQAPDKSNNQFSEPENSGSTDFLLTIDQDNNMSAAGTRPSTYSDSPKEDILDFISLYENECDAFGWEGNQKLHKIKIAFTGNALIRFNKNIKFTKLGNNNTTVPRTWEEVKEDIIKLFNKTKPELRLRLIKRVYEGEHDFHDYVNFVIKTSKELDPNESDYVILKRILGGLPNQLREFIAKEKVEKTDELNKAFDEYLRFRDVTQTNLDPSTAREMEEMKKTIETLSNRVNTVSIINTEPNNKEEIMKGMVANINEKQNDPTFEAIIKKLEQNYNLTPKNQNYKNKNFDQNFDKNKNFNSNQRNQNNNYGNNRNNYQNRGQNQNYNNNSGNYINRNQNFRQNQNQNNTNFRNNNQNQNYQNKNYQNYETRPNNNNFGNNNGFRNQRNNNYPDRNYNDRNYNDRSYNNYGNNQNRRNYNNNGYNNNNYTRNYPLEINEIGTTPLAQITYPVQQAIMPAPIQYQSYLPALPMPQTTQPIVQSLPALPSIPNSKN